MTHRTDTAKGHACRGVRTALLSTAVALAGLTLLGTPAQAAAEPRYTIKTLWGDTNLPPGEEGQFVVQPRNVGNSPGLEEDLTISDELPQGVEATNIAWRSAGLELSFLCSGVGTETATCTAPSSFVPFLTQPLHPNAGGWDGAVPSVIIDVAVDPDASGTGTNVATISGGGGEAASDTDSVDFSATPSSFGLVGESFEADPFDDEWPEGASERQAGAHPYELRVNFDFNQRTGIDDGGAIQADGLRYTEPTGRVKDVEVTLPHGFTGNPEATPKCDQVDFSVSEFLAHNTKCPADTQVGYLTLGLSAGKTLNGFGFFDAQAALHPVAVYNLVPPKGKIADFGFFASGYVQGHIYPSLDPSQNYAIKALTPEISTAAGIRNVRVTFWGVPSDPSHDRFRYYPEVQPNGDRLGAPFGTAPIRPLLANPTDCGVDNGGSLIRVDSWNDPGNYTPIEESDDHLNVEGCDDPRFRFEPDVALQPTDRHAGAPTGLDVHLEVPQRSDVVPKASDLYEQNGDVQAIPTPPMKKAVVTFPEGMTISPSAAQGLGNCSSAQLGLGTNAPVTCPDNSQYGKLILHTPLLPVHAQPEGYIYIAKQNDNPFNNFLSLYLVIEEPERGIRVKIPGKVELDPKTGQIKTTFDNLPQFPVSDMQLTFKGGVRAALVNPSTCGTKTIRAEFFSWHDPATPKVVNDRYSVTQKPDGSPCVNNLGERPFAPELSAGTINPSAGAYSPFVFRLTRTDDDQEFSQLGVTLPPGLLANISGVSECSEAGIRQAGAEGRSALEEQMAPSCPASSQLGSTDVGAGVGVPLTYVPGKAYLAGPYQGAPLSMVVITPLQVGPYDLGVIAVRSAIHVDAQDAQASITTDPFPQIFKGIPVRIRDIRVKADRPNTMLNPTSCDPMAVSAHVTGTGGDVNTTADDTAADLSERFQAVNCASLGFKPSLRFKLKGGTKRGDFPALRAILKARPGDANIARTTVILPRSEFIEQGHIRTVCTRVQFAADQCPPGSVYGTATAKSPLFDETLSGPVYLRSNGGERLLPDLVVSLNGKIDVALAGFIDSVQNGRVRNTFDVIPDAPVTKFVLSMKGGKRGLLVNHLDLCEVTSRADVKMVGQNGKTSHARPKMETSCKNGQKGKGRGR